MSTTPTPRPARALIVDDEAPAREELRWLLERIDGVEVLGEATNGAEALGLLRAIDYDLVLLDIHMPGGTGLEVARELRAQPRSPAVVFTTAYPEHAVDAFEVQADGYLLKPIDGEKLAELVARLGTADPLGVDPSPTGPAPAPPVRRLPVQLGDRTVLVDAADVVFADAARGYVSLHLAERKVLVSWTLAELEDRLGPEMVRVHRSALVNLAHVRELRHDARGTLQVVMGDREGSRVEVSRRQARVLRDRLGM